MKEPRKVPFIPGAADREVDSELRFHLEERVQRYIAQGMSPEEARHAAVERFGDVDGVRSECTQLLDEERKTRARRDWFADLGQDLRFAARSALRAPLFTGLAVATLALGIGANAAVFGVVKSVLLNSLPYADADRLMRIRSPLRAEGSGEGSLSAGTIMDFRERQRSFVSSGAFLFSRDVTYTGGDVPRVMQAQWVEPELFQTLGVRFILGANFRPEDAARDTSFTTVLPYATWRSLFNGDDDVIGRTIRVNNISRTIVGVLAEDVIAPDGDTDFYFGLAVAPYLRDTISARGSHNFGMVGRLKPGVSPAAADRELRAIGVEIERLYAKDNAGFDLTGQPLRDDMVGETRTPLLVLLASAALVLLITCANLAGALLSRTISRRKEFAVRVALGAGRGRLVRQLLTESVLLAVAGGVAGVLLAIMLLGGLRGLSVDVIPRYADLSLDAAAIGVTFAITLITGLAFGLGPALSVGRADPQGTLRDETRGSTESVHTRRLRGALVAGQIALCVSLLAAAGLLTRSLWEMMNAPLGFRPEQVLTFTVQLPGGPRWGEPATRGAFYDEMSERLRALPGVTGVAIADQYPTRIGNSNGIFLEGRPWGANEPVPFTLTTRVHDDFFQALGIPLRQGRAFTRADGPDAPSVVIINEAMAERYWPQGNALGSRIRYGPPREDQPWVSIVGIVGNTRNSPTALRPEPIMYFPLRQQPNGANFMVRTAGEPTAITGAARTLLRDIDPALPMFRLSTLADVVGENYAARRLPVMLMVGFGALALLVASVGIYAMFATMATAREREFGVRIALGASPRGVASLILRQGGAWMAVGLLVGGIGVIAAARLVRTQLYGVPAFDPVTIGGAVLVLLACGGLALIGPVRRATRVDPITVLR